MPNAKLSRLASGPSHVVEDPPVARCAPSSDHAFQATEIVARVAVSPTSRVRRRARVDGRGSNLRPTPMAVRRIRKKTVTETADRPVGVEDTFAVEDLGQGQVFEQVAPVPGRLCCRANQSHGDDGVIELNDGDGLAGQEAARRSDGSLFRCASHDRPEHQEPDEDENGTGRVERRRYRVRSRPRVEPAPGGKLEHGEHHAGNDGDRGIDVHLADNGECGAGQDRRRIGGQRCPTPRDRRSSARLDQRWDLTRYHGVCGSTQEARRRPDRTPSVESAAVGASAGVARGVTRHCLSPMTSLSWATREITFLNSPNHSMLCRA